MRQTFKSTLSRNAYMVAFVAQNRAWDTFLAFAHQALDGNYEGLHGYTSIDDDGLAVKEFSFPFANVAPERRSLIEQAWRTYCEEAQPTSMNTFRAETRLE